MFSRSPFDLQRMREPIGARHLDNLRWSGGCRDRREMWLPGASGWVLSRVACGRCSQCRRSKKLSVCNSALMELDGSGWAAFVTLTFDDRKSEPHWSKILDLGHMQRFHKRCRINAERGQGSFAGRDCKSWRYMQAGEYGTKKGRAHYHAIIFGTGDRPDWPEGNRVHIPEWPYGHCQIRFDVGLRNINYVAKYMMKAEGGEAVYSCSNRPALGAFASMEAALHLAVTVGSRALPRNFRLSVPTLTDWQSAPLLGAKRRHFIAAFAEAHGLEIMQLAPLSPEIMGPSIRAAAKYEALKRERDEWRALAGEPELRRSKLDKLIDGMRDEINRSASLFKSAKAVEQAQETAEHLAALPVMVPDPHFVPDNWRDDRRSRFSRDRRQRSPPLPFYGAPSLQEALQGVYSTEKPGLTRQNPAS